MRKPDPGDLIPANVTSATSRSATPTSTRFTASSGNLSDIRKLHEAQRAEGSAGGTDEDSDDFRVQQKSSSKEISKRVWSSTSSLAEGTESGDETTQPENLSREVMEQDFEPTTDEDEGERPKQRKRHVSAGAEWEPSSSGSSSTASGSKSSDSSQGRPPLRRRSDTLPSRTLTPSQLANSSPDEAAPSATRKTSTATPSVSNNGKTTPSTSIRSSNPSSTRAPTPLSAPAGGKSGRSAKERQKSSTVSDSGTPLPERPRSYSGKSAAKSGMVGTNASNGSSLGRAAALAASRERGSLHAALTDGLGDSFPASTPALQSSASADPISANRANKDMSLLGASHPLASLSTTTVGSLSSASSSGRESPALSVSSQGSSSGKSQSSSAASRARSNLAPATLASQPAPVLPRTLVRSASSPQEVASPRMGASKPASSNRQRVSVVVRHTPSSGSMASVRSGSTSSSASSNSTLTGKEKNHSRRPSSPSEQSNSSSASFNNSSSSSGKRPTKRVGSSSS